MMISVSLAILLGHVTSCYELLYILNNNFKNGGIVRVTQLGWLG